MQSVLGYAALIAGFVCAGLGGELFVRGAAGLSRWLRVAPGIVGATVAAFATSSPELAVSVSAALAGRPQVGLGDAIGSNVVNVALVLAVALLIAPMRCEPGAARRDWRFALLAPAATAALLIDGRLSRGDGLLLLALFAAWLLATLSEARRRREPATAAPTTGERRRVLLACTVGLVLLALAGQLIVTGARTVASSLGVGDFVVGAALVAFGTSIPELATTVVAQLRGHVDIGLGTVLGSNIFNGLFIVGTAAAIHPIVVGWQAVAATLAFGVAALALLRPDRQHRIVRVRGALLLALYAGYLIVLALWLPTLPPR